MILGMTSSELGGLCRVYTIQLLDLDCSKKYGQLSEWESRTVELIMRHSSSRLYNCVTRNPARSAIDPIDSVAGVWKILQTVGFTSVDCCCRSNVNSSIAVCVWHFC